MYLSKILFLGLLLPLISFGQYNSWDGVPYGIKPNSKFRTLNIFINVIYDVNPSHNANFPTNQNWGQASTEGVNNEAIPDFLLNFIDTIYNPNIRRGTLTELYGESSFDSLQIIGDFIVVNVKESRILTYPIINSNYCQGTSFCIDNIKKASIALINELGGLQTIYGRNKIGDYDFKQINQLYFTNVMIRNITAIYGGINAGSGFGSSGLSDETIKISKQFYSFSGNGTFQCIGSENFALNISSILKHEFSHSLFGGNEFHASGGNHRGSSERMPFLSCQGGYGLMGAADVGLVSCNGYDRWRMHWKHQNAPDFITARNISNTNYQISDIKKEDGNKSFVLRDFVTHGDAIRIKMPFKDNISCSNQYIWLENHQICNTNKLDFLQYSNYPNTYCRPAGKNGIYAYYQVGRDVLSGSYSDVWFTHERDNLRIISAEGSWDYETHFPSNNYSIDCVSWEPHSYYHKRSFANPFCGNQDQEGVIFPPTNSSTLSLFDFRQMWRKIVDGQNIDSLVFLGDNRDAFSSYSKINMSSNPSTCNAKTYYNNLDVYGGCDYTSESYRNNETTYLTGLSIEMIHQTNNTLRVNIRWDDYEITNSTNWTGKIALKEIAVLKPGNTINLLQNRTPAQFTRDAESGLFAKTSFFVCENNSEFLQEPKTTIIVDEKSKMIIKNGANYAISDSAKLIIKEGYLEIENGANFYIYKSGELIIENKGIVTISNSTFFDNKAKITIHQGGKLIIDCGTLTNASDGEMWLGITNYGAVEIINGGKIENAVCAIRSLNGGSITTNGASFINNKTAIEINEYQTIETNLQVSLNCDTFLINDSYLGNLLDFEAHIKLFSSGKTKVAGCVFANNCSQKSYEDNKNIGIFGFNPKLQVTYGRINNTNQNSSFSGFNQAISVGNSGTSPSVKIARTNFSSNRIGVNINGINYTYTTSSEYKFTSLLTYNNIIGLSVKNATGYNIARNTFRNLNAQPIGLQISNSGAAENKTYKNTFENLRIGQHFDSINASNSSSKLITGLQFCCIENINNSTFDVLVGSNIGGQTHLIRKLQGSLSKPAGNSFTEIDTFAINLDFYHIGSYAADTFNYYYSTSIANQKPLAVYSKVNVIESTNINNCPKYEFTTDSIPDLDLDFALAQYDIWHKEYELWLQKLNNYSGNENAEYDYLEQQISYYSALKDNYFNEIIRQTLHGNTVHRGLSPSNFEGVREAGGSLYENLRFLFAYRGQYQDYLSITETFLAEQNYETALSTLDNISVLFVLSAHQTQEINSLKTYINWLAQLAQHNQTIYQLTEKEVNYLLTFVVNNVGRSVVFAQNILCMLHNLCPEETEIGDAVHGGMVHGGTVHGEGAKGRMDEGGFSPSNFEGVREAGGSLYLDKITITPNPTNGELRIENVECKINKVEILDLTGKKLLTISDKRLTINIAALKAGIYFVKIATEQGEVIRKIIKQ